MNLNNNEQEISKIQLEEYALKLDAKDVACRSKAKAKPQRREPIISHGSNRFVMNLNNNETEIPEVQLEEYALQLDAKDFASRSKAKATPQRREPAGSSPRTVPIG